MSAPDHFDAHAATPQRWLAVVGIGEDGIDGLGAAARQLISQAEVVFGGKRHLRLAAPVIRGAARPWPSPFAGALDEVLARRGRNTCVLASGDPMCHGVGVLLARKLEAREMIIVPAASAFSLAAARLGWALTEVALVSLHGQSIDLVRRYLQPAARVLALTSDGEGPPALARLLTQTGFGASRVTVLEALGGPRESIRCARAADFNLAAIDPLNVVAIEVAGAPDARVISSAAGLADELFEHDGQLTKRDVRAVSLSSLAPCRGELLWDIGAGSGSIAIEWMLCDPLMRAVAIEARPDRAARIRRNACMLGVPTLQIVQGAAPAAFDGLPPPDAIFIGGGVSDAGVLNGAMTQLRAGGRLVANVVTLEGEAVLLTHHAGSGGQLLRLAMTRADMIGGMRSWQPARPITQWSWTKP